MALTVAPHVNLEALQNLRADKQYFLSSTTGEIKEASFWMRFKCAIGISSARQKVSNLLDAVRNSLLDAARLDSNATLDEGLRGVDMRYMVQGSVIKDIASRFSATNSAQLAKTNAGSIIAGEAKMLAGQLITHHFNIGESAALEKIIHHALKPQLEGQLPMKQDANGRRVLDAMAFRHSLHDALNAARELIEAIARSGKVDRIDQLYANHVVKQLFNADGTRNDRPVAELKTKLEAQVEYTFFIKGEGLGSRASSVHDELMRLGAKNGKADFPAEMLEKIFGFCGNDLELKEFVLEVAPELCVDSNRYLRSDSTIKARVEGLKANLAEIRNLERSFPGCAKALKSALAVLNGKAFPPGLLTEMGAFIRNAKVANLAKLNSLSSASQIYEGVDEIRAIIQQFFAQVDVTKRFEDAGEDEVGGPNAVATRSALASLALAKAGPGLAARLPSIIKGTEFGRVNSFVLRLMGDLSGDTFTLERKREAEELLDLQANICTFIDSYVNNDRENPVIVPEVEIDYQNEEVGYMLGTLTEAAAKA